MQTPKGCYALQVEQGDTPQAVILRERSDRRISARVMVR